MKTEEIHQRILGGEDETLELKSSIKSPAKLAHQLAAFSNCNGGMLVLGVKEPGTIMGVDVDRAKSVLARAQDYLAPRAQMEIEVHSIEGKDIVVAKVQPADRLIAARGGYYRRVATDTRPLKAEEIVAHAKKHIDNDSAIKELSDVIATQTGTIDELRKDFNRANSLKRKLFIAVLGAVVGAVGKHIISLIG